MRNFIKSITKHSPVRSGPVIIYHLTAGFPHSIVLKRLLKKDLLIELNDRLCDGIAEGVEAYQFRDVYRQSEADALLDLYKKPSPIEWMVGEPLRYQDILDRERWLKFDTGYVILGVEVGYDAGDERVVEQQDIDLMYLSPERAAQFEIIDPAELMEYREFENQKQAFKREQAERREYEQLKAKFEK